jgi:Plant transposon protein
MGQEISKPLVEAFAESERKTGFSFSEDDGFWEVRDDFADNGEEELAQVILNMLKMVMEDNDVIDSEDGDTSAFKEGDNFEEARPKKKRRAKQVSTYTDANGERQRLHPKMSHWYNIYVEHPNLDNSRFQRLFRRRFRLPHAQFVELAQSMEESDCFGKWKDGKKDARGVESSPLRLLLLCALRYLGRGWTFDDLSESTAISEDVIRVFFHAFIDFGSTVLFAKYVVAPTNSEEAKQHMGEFEQAGFAGAMGSSDATHIVLERILYRHRHAHNGFKLSHTARTYNITVNHRRRILATMYGHPATWNDKTLVQFDDFMKGIQEGRLFADHVFELFDYDDSMNVIKHKYSGAWILVDNGYLNWPTTVPPMKITTSRAEIRFSAWLESMRKDVECTFGILKGRWRILKTGIRLHGTENADKIWKTCCALHNMLLEVDGLDEKWEDGVQRIMLPMINDIICDSLICCKKLRYRIVQRSERIDCLTIKARHQSTTASCCCCCCAFLPCVADSIGSRQGHSIFSGFSCN